MRIKTICVIGGDDGTSPSRVNIYKNELSPDINVLEDRIPV
jgi:hypothetical protein